MLAIDERIPEKIPLRISIVIPCYNEEENIVDTVNMIMTGIDDSVSDYEIILVDDGSMDNSREVMNGLVENNGKIRAFYLPGNTGKGAALRSGFAQARMEWILAMDADMQIDIKELKSYLPFCNEYDIITGYRVDRNERFARSAVSKIYNFVASTVTGTTVHDVGCPFKLLKKSVVNKLNLASNGFVVDTEIFQNATLRNYLIKELPVKCKPRLKGKSSVKIQHLFATFMGIIKLKFKKSP